MRFSSAKLSTAFLTALYHTVFATGLLYFSILRVLTEYPKQYPLFDYRQKQKRVQITVQIPSVAHSQESTRGETVEKHTRNQV